MRLSLVSDEMAFTKSECPHCRKAVNISWSTYNSLCCGRTEVVVCQHCLQSLPYKRDIFMEKNKL